MVLAHTRHRVSDQLDLWSDPVQQLLYSYGAEGRLGFVVDVHLSQTGTLRLLKKEKSLCLQECVLHSKIPSDVKSFLSRFKKKLNQFDIWIIADLWELPVVV